MDRMRTENIRGTLPLLDVVEMEPERDRSEDQGGGTLRFEGRRRRRFMEDMKLVGRCRMQWEALNGGRSFCCGCP